MPLDAVRTWACSLLNRYLKGIASTVISKDHDQPPTPSMTLKRAAEAGAEAWWRGAIADNHERGEPMSGSYQNHAFLTTEEAADYLRVTKYTVWRWCKEGHLPAFQIGRQWRIRKEKLDALIEQLEAEGGELISDGQEPE